jgi:dTDP-4-dehydrorhamnose reductase
VKILLLGADTSLGLALQDHLRLWRRHEVEALSSAACRWKGERHAKKAVRRSDCEILVDLRIKAASDCGELDNEKDLERCHWLAKACQSKGAAYLYLSGARVFSGALGRSYTEEDKPDSESAVGLLMQLGENGVRERCERHLILRMGPVFSHRGYNILTHMLGQISEKGSLLLDNSTHGCPVGDIDAARVVAALLDQLSTGIEPWGIYHYCSSDPTNCYEFGESLLASASQFTQYPEGALQLDHAAASAAVTNRVLDCGKIRNNFAIKQVTWRNAIGDSVKHYFQEQT